MIKVLLHSSTRFLLATGLAVFFSANVASATLLTFFGEDINGTATPLVNTPNSDAAQAQFLGLLDGVGTESFESHELGATPNFDDWTWEVEALFNGSAGNVTATLSTPVLSGAALGVSDTEDGFNGNYAVSGDQYVSISPDQPTGGQLSVNFDQEVSAFGFFATDLGDFGGQLTLEIDGEAPVTVPHSVFGGGNGNVLFFGVIGLGETFSEIVFNLVGDTLNAGLDSFTLDNMTVGDAGQVGVPEPTSMVLLGFALAGAGLRRRSA